MTRFAGDARTDSSADRVRLVAWRATGLAVLLILAALAATADYWTSVGPEGGDVRFVLPDRRNPSVLYAAAYQSGLFRSVDSGDHWTPINEGLTVDGGDLNRSLIVLAQSPEGTLYAASSGYLYGSQDGGDHWSRMGRSVYMTSIQALAAGPSGFLLVGTRRNGLFLTTDDGRTWVQPYGGLTEEFRAVAIHPGDPNLMYAGGPASMGRSADGGKSWERVSGGVLQALALDPDDPSIVYTADSIFVSRSTDRSASYQSVPTPSKTLRSIAVMKGSPSAIFAVADDGIFRSVDDGKTWSRVFEGGYGVHVAAAGAAGVYVGTGARGVLRSLDRGETWTAVTSGFLAGRIARLAFHERTDGPLLAGVFGYGLVRTSDGGRSWLAGPEAFGGLAYADFRCFAAAPGAAGVVYTGGLTLARSQDNGLTWEQRSLPDFWACDHLAVDPSNPSVLYLGNRIDRIYKSMDAGLTWTPSDSGLPNEPLFQISVDGSSPSTVYAAMRAGIYKSTDGATTWRQSLSRWPTALAIAPGDHKTLYVDAFAYGIHKSTDGGETWSGPLSSELTDIVVLAVSPLDSSVVYAGTAYSGVYRSTDSGKTWSSLKAALPNRWVTGLAIDPSGLVYSALDGAGVFLLQESLRPPDALGVRPPTRAVGIRK